MRELPFYAFLTNPSEFEGMKVILLEPPYIIANIFEVSQNNPEKIESFIEDKVQGRCPVGKVQGYSVFLKMFTSLEPCDDMEYQQEILDEMAEFVLEERIKRKPGQFKGCDESGRTEKILQKGAERAIRMRERKKRSNE